MRIGIDASCLPPVPAGAGRYVIGLIHSLARLDRRNEYFVFLKERDGGLASRFPPNMRPVFLPNLSRPLRLLYQHGIAAVHAQQLRLDVWHGTHYSLPRFARRLRLVSTFHDLSFIELPEYFSAAKRFYFRRALTDAAARATAIVCVSEATREALQRHFAVAGRAVTVHSGVAPIFFSRVRAAEITHVRQRWNIDQAYVLFLGTLEPHKNVALVLYALAALRENGRDRLQFVIARQRGGGWPEMQSVIRQLNLEAAARLTGYIPEDDLPALYQGARLVVLPSLAEGFGFTALEAMAGGVPVLAACAVGGHGGAAAEVISHPQMLCENDPRRWAAKIEQLIEDQALRRELSIYGIERARQFSWSMTAQRMVEVYESLGNHSARRFFFRVICFFPFVKGVALSGAASFENCQASDDLDLFIIADGRRLWLTYSTLVLILKMLGKRKLLCMNYLIGHHDLAIYGRDFFVGHQIAFLRPLRGREVFQHFFRANHWIHRFLPQTALHWPAPPGRFAGYR